MMAAQTTSVQWPLAAREGELGAFEQVWARRSCQGAVVAGPAGVGKSWLAGEYLARAVRGGLKGRRATASAAAAAVPLGAIAHLIPAGVDLSDPVTGFAEVARALAGPSRDRRWAVLVDDVHLLDATSAVLLRQLMDAGLVRLIATLRTGEPTGEAVQALCGHDTVGRIDLDAFDQEQTELVLHAALGRPVSRRMAQELYTASGGNALYLRELVQGALADGSLVFDGEIWELTKGRTAATPRLTELITARLAGAASQALTVLDLLALCEPLPLADAETVTADPQTLPQLEENGLIHVDTQRLRSSVSLSHPLYGETLRSRIGTARRHDLLLAQVDRTRAYGARRREDPLNIAAWQLAATGTADPDLLTQAAFIARYAHDYSQAFTLLKALPDHRHTTGTRLLLGEVLFELGDSDRAEQVLQAADAHAREEQEILAVTLARTFNLCWSAARAAQAMEINDAVRVRVTSEQGLRMLRYNEGWMRIHCGEPARGLSLLDDIEDDIDDATNPTGWILGMAMKPVGLALVGRTGEAVTASEKTREALVAHADRALAAHPATTMNVLTFALAENGQLGRARDVGIQGYTELTAARVPLPRMWTAVQIGRVELLAGHLATARRWFADAAAMARGHHHATAMQAALCGMAVTAAMLGDRDAAEQAFTEACDYPPFQALFDLSALSQGWLMAARGDLAAARGLLLDAAAKASSDGMLGYESWLLADVARLGGARQVHARLAELAEACDGVFVVFRAHLAAALAADDPDRLMESAQELAAIGADLMAAEAATTAAAAHQRAGRVRRATAAAHIAHACGARCEGARTPLLGATQATTELSARERDIALLAARGTPSKEIAEVLHLSVRTVENHLQHAYTKLGVTTRGELKTVLFKPSRSSPGR